ncbi:MAG: hypothetical protein H6621_04800 [Halobacteriovoraceae bacterium]|nr:hypothetical protein [Halobacteriovoraceae bacterium]
MKKFNLFKTVFFVVLFFVVSYATYKYWSPPRSSLSLKIKRELEDGKRIKAKKWNEIKAIDLPVVTTKPPNSLPRETSSQIAKRLEKSMQKFKSLKLDSLEEAIKTASDLIDREPDSYSSYKAKLILLLTKEAKFHQDIEDNEIEYILGKMAEFDTTSDKAIQKESFIIAQANSELDKVEARIDELEYQLDTLETEEDFEEAPLIQHELEQNYLQADRIEDELEDKLIQNDLAANENLIEIPFLRDLAKKEYLKVIDDADAYLDEYPNSLAVNFILIKALQLNGETDAARDIIENLNLDSTDLQKLQNRLSETSTPEEYWKKFHF